MAVHWTELARRGRHRPFTKSRSRRRRALRRLPNRLRTEIRLWTQPAERITCYRAVLRHRPSGAKGHKATKEAWLKVVKNCLTPQHVMVCTEDGVLGDVWVDMSAKCKAYTTEEVVEKAKGFFDSRRRNFLQDRKRDERKTGEDAEEVDEFADEEFSEGYELAQACLAWEEAKESKSAGVVNKEDSRRGIDSRDRAQDAMLVGKGKGSSRGAGRKHGEGGSGGGRSSGLSTSAARAAAGDASKNRSRGVDCRFRGDRDDDDDDDDDDNESSSGDGGGGAGSSTDDSESAYEDVRALDKRETMIASGSAGRATRSARGGGKRQRSIEPLSSGTSAHSVQDLLANCVNHLTRKPAEGDGGAATNSQMNALLQRVDNVQAGVQQSLAIVLQQAQQQAQINAALFARLEGRAVGVQAPVLQPGLGMLGGLGGVPYPSIGGTSVLAVGGGGRRGDSAVAVGVSRAPVGVGPLPLAVAQGASAPGAPPASTRSGDSAVEVDAGARKKTSPPTSAMGARAAGAEPSAPILPGFPTGTTVPLCAHRIPCVRIEVKSGANAGWVFYRCGEHDRNEMCTFTQDVVPRGSAGNAASGRGDGQGGTVQPERQRSRGGVTAETFSSKQKKRRR